MDVAVCSSSQLEDGDRAGRKRKTDKSFDDQDDSDKNTDKDSDVDDDNEEETEVLLYCLARRTLVEVSEGQKEMY